MAEQVWTQHEGVMCVGMNWERWTDFDTIKVITSVLLWMGYRSDKF